MNQLISYLLAFLVTIGGTVGLINDPFEEQISDNVDQVHNAVIGIHNESIGQFRADCQDTEQFIVKKYQESSNDTALSPKHKELNKKYQEYLYESWCFVDSQLKGNEYNSTRMDELYKELN